MNPIISEGSEFKGKEFEIWLFFIVLDNALVISSIRRDDLDSDDDIDILCKVMSFWKTTMNQVNWKVEIIYSTVGKIWLVCNSF